MIPVVTTSSAPRLHRVSMDVARSYRDVPGALRATEDALLAELRQPLTERYGADAAALCEPLVVWDLKLPRWPGDRSVLRAVLNVTIQQA